MANRTLERGVLLLAMCGAAGLGCSSKGAVSTDAAADSGDGTPVACRVTLDNDLDPCAGTLAAQETQYPLMDFGQPSSCVGGNIGFETRTPDHVWDCAYGGDGTLLGWDRIESTSLCGGRASAVVADLYSQGQLMDCLSVDSWTWLLGFDPGPTTIAMQLSEGTIGSGDTISPGFAFLLSGAEVAGSDLTFRYWYTADGTGAGAPPQSASCTGSDGLECDANVPLLTLVPVSPARPTADTYLEVSFPQTGIISTGFDFLLGVSITRTDGALYDQSNDYSYNGATQFTPTTKVTAYVKGALIYGAEP
jgi:hypothetical protein